MPLPDVATVHLCSVLASTAFGIMFAVLWFARDRSAFYALASLGALNYAATLLGLGALDAQSGLAVRALLCVGLAMYNSLLLAAVRSFEGQRLLDAWTVAPPIATGLAFVAVMVLPVPVAGWSPVEAARTINSVMLGFGTLAIGVLMLRTRGSRAPRSRRILAWVQLAYVPSYIASVALEGAGSQVDWLALVPMLSDQLLLGVLNIALLAMTGERAEIALRDAALRDPLTGAWNRAGLDALRVCAGTGVILFDVDHFKRINDQLGHAAGDAILVSLCRIARERLPKGAHVVRLGGDEFVAMLPGLTDPAALRAIAESLRTAATPPATLSLGLAHVQPGEASPAPALARADVMLYRAKAAGRDRLAA